MFQSHYASILVGYAVAFAGWLVVARRFPALWPAREEASFDRPWVEFGIAFAAGIGVLVVGQLWLRGIRLPEAGSLGPLAGALNQGFIFAPLALLPLYRRHAPDTAWLPRPRAGARFGTGVALATLAIVAYSLAREGASAPWEMEARIISYQHIDELTQVFLEDVVIAILFVRLAAAIGARWAVVLVAALFAAGHIPTLLSEGASAAELLPLLRDVGLGVVAISVLRRAKDILWFWPVHFMMDMSQFERITFG